MRFPYNRREHMKKQSAQKAAAFFLIYKEGGRVVDDG